MPPKDPSIENRRTVPEFGLRRILELLHKAVDKIGVSSGKSVGRDDRLWHRKSPNLPKASSQSPRTPVLLTALAQKKPLLTKRREPKPPERRFQRREPAYCPRIRQSRILELLLMAVPKTGVFRCKTRNRQTIQEFCFAEFLSFCTRLFLKQEFPDAKAGYRAERTTRIPLL